jgi:phenylacetate-coenzyme A ligase PaaK-like adenylate-forming protein
MRLDFSDLPLKETAFSDKPMTFIDQGPKNFLGAVMDLVAIETGDRRAREHWQQKQIDNLLSHAARKSAFWRKRIGANKAANFERLPVLTRADVRTQVEAEGSLLAGERIKTMKHATSGSSGTPIQFFISQMHTEYLGVRSAAQLFIEQRDLTLNSTRLRPEPKPSRDGFTVQIRGDALGSLASLVRGGKYKYIEYFHPNMDALCKELERDSIGYLVAHPHLVEAMLQFIDPEFFKRAGTAMFNPVAGAVDPGLREAFVSIGIPVRGSYSSEEVGSIGFECEKSPGIYHLATSNVIVEVIADNSVGGIAPDLGRVLVTHLHSYATPFIRYDIGDVATLGNSCPCGHDGPVLSNIYGRSKALLKHPDGRVSIFFPRGKELAAIAQFDEFRIRQTEIRKIVLELGGREALSEKERTAFIRLINEHAGGDFEVEVKAVAAIDWGQNSKRLGFYSEVL